MITAAVVAGMVGLAASCVWPLLPSRRCVTVVQTIGGFGYIGHWLLLGAMSAALLSALITSTGIIAYLLEGATPGGARSRFLRAAFLMALVIAGVVVGASWSGFTSLLATAGTGLICYARWQSDPARFRAAMFASSLPWLGHDLLVGSAAAAGADLICLGQFAWQRLKRSTRQIFLGLMSPFSPSPPAV